MYNKSTPQPECAVKVPGKLFIIGEYAILQPGAQAIVMSVDKYLTAQIKPGSGRINSQLDGLGPIYYRNGAFSGQTSGWEPVISAIQVIQETLDESIPSFDLSFSSELVDQNGTKYGLGSSGAVVVSTIRALLAYLGLKASDLDTFKLAAISVLKTGSNSSLADLSPLVYGGVTRYKNFNRKWLKDKITSGQKILDLVKMDWPGLEIENLTIPLDWCLAVGWSGEPASTENLVSKFWSTLTQYEVPDMFLNTCELIVDQAVLAVKNNQAYSFFEAVKNYQGLISDYDKKLNVGIVTPQLNTLNQIALELGAVSKFSGAGGGDCGLAFWVKGTVDKPLLYSKWQEAGITPLDLKPSPQSNIVLSLASQRKDDHYQLALKQASSWVEGQNKENESNFSEIRLVHHSLRAGNIDQIDLSTTWANHTHQSPFYINAMTGGSSLTKKVNQELATLARELNLPIASGSLSIALSDKSSHDSFKILRQTYPNGFIMANLGAHHSLENAQRAVDLIQADAIQIHLNSPQEIAMPEGDRDLSGWLDNIKQIVEGIKLPVIVKETGFGMSRETIQDLISIGVRTIDVSGRGGTDFSQIENERNNDFDFSFLKDFGQTTAESLLEAQDYLDQVDILASGGIKNYWEAFKALALGSKGVGLAGKVIHSLNKFGLDSTIDELANWHQALKHLMLMTGTYKISDISQVDLVITGDLRKWAQVRKINIEKLANR